MPHSGGRDANRSWRGKKEIRRQNLDRRRHRRYFGLRSKNRGRSRCVRDREQWSIRRALRIRVDRKSTRLNSSHSQISYAVFCLNKKNAPDRLFPTPIQISAHKRENETITAPVLLHIDPESPST